MAKKFNKKQKAVIQNFYETSLTDPILIDFVKELQAVPEQTEEFFEIMNRVHFYLDTKCQAALRDTITQSKKISKE
jgi:hypothetical protein